MFYMNKVVKEISKVLNIFQMFQKQLFTTSN